MNEKLVVVVLMLLLSTCLIGCTENQQRYDSFNIDYTPTYWEELINPDAFIVHHNYTYHFYNFTEYGLRDALDDMNGKENVTFTFRNDSMNVTKVHKNNSMFFVNGTNWNFIGKGNNYIIRHTPHPIIERFFDRVFYSNFSVEVKHLFNDIYNSMFVEHKRSNIDTVFIVNSSMDIPVFKFFGCNLHIEGLEVVFENPYDGIAFHCEASNSYLSDLSVINLHGEFLT